MSVRQAAARHQRDLVFARRERRRARDRTEARTPTALTSATEFKGQATGPASSCRLPRAPGGSHRVGRAFRGVQGHASIRQSARRLSTSAEASAIASLVRAPRTRHQMSVHVIGQREQIRRSIGIPQPEPLVVQEQRSGKELVGGRLARCIPQSARAPGDHRPSPFGRPRSEVSRGRGIDARFRSSDRERDAPACDGRPMSAAASARSASHHAERQGDMPKASPSRPRSRRPSAVRGLPCHSATRP